MYENYIVGTRHIKPYVVSDKDIAQLRKKFRGKETKVKAVVLLAQNNGYIKQQEVADLCGITRMTLYRWRTIDKTFNTECDRLTDKAISYTKATYYRIARRKHFSMADICRGYHRTIEDIIEDYPVMILP